MSPYWPLLELREFACGGRERFASTNEYLGLYPLKELVYQRVLKYFLIEASFVDVGIFCGSQMIINTLESLDELVR